MYKSSIKSAEANPQKEKGKILFTISRESDLLSLILVRMIIKSDETANVRVYNADLPNRQITPSGGFMGRVKIQSMKHPNIIIGDIQ